VHNLTDKDNTMELKFDPPDLPADFDPVIFDPPAFDDPALPSFVDVGGAQGLFGDAFNGENSYAKDHMTQSSMLPWSLGEVGYEYVAPHVQADGRVEGALHPPDYYAYSAPPASSWSDGLQEIEDFDWSGGKDTEQNALASEEQVQGREDIPPIETADTSQAISLKERGAEPIELESVTQTDEAQGRESIPVVVSADSSDVAKPAESMTFADDDVMNSEETVPELDVQPEGPVQQFESVPPTASNTSTPEATSTEASRIPYASPPWIPEPVSESAPTHALQSLPIESSIEASSAEVNDEHVEAPEQMDIDDTPATSMRGLEEEALPKNESHIDKDSLGLPAEESAVAVAHGNNGISDDVVNDAAEENTSTPMEPVTLLEAPTQELPNPKYAHEPSMEPEASSKAITADDVVAAYSELAASSLPLVEDVPDEPESVAASADGPTRASPEPKFIGEQSMAPEAAFRTVTSEDVVAAHSKPAPPSPLPQKHVAEEPDATIAPAHVPTQEIPDRKPIGEPSVALEADSNTVTLEDVVAAYSKPASPLSLLVEGVLDESDTTTAPAQLQQAAEESSLKGLSELLPSGYSGGPDLTAKATTPTDMDEELVQASPVTGRATELPPYPYGSTPGANRADEAEADEHQDVETGAQHDDSTSRSQSEVHAPVIDDVDEMTADDLNSNPVMVKSPEVPVEETTGDESLPIPATIGSNAFEGLQPTLSAPKSKAKATIPRKRAKTTKKSKDASESEEEAPVKKKPRKSAPAKPRASRAKKIKVPEDQEDDIEAPPPKKQRTATKSKKETLPAEAAITAQPPKQDVSTSKFGHFALGKYADPNGEITFATEEEFQQPDYNGDDIDMEEHYTDVQTPSPSKRDRHLVSNRELESLSGTKYRDRPSQARSRMPIEEGSRFKKSDIFGTMMSSASKSRLGDSVSVPPKNDNSFLLIEPETNAASSTPTAANPPGASKKAQPKKTPAPRASRKKKATPAPKPEEEDDPESLREAEYEEAEPDLFPAPKIDVKAAVKKAPLPAPPKMMASMGRSTRSKKAATEEPEEPEEEAITSVEDDMVDKLDQDAEPNDSEDIQDTFNPRAEDSVDLSDDTAIANVKKGKKKKGNSLLADVLSKSASPAPSAASSATSGNNKYGFASPRGPKTRQARKAAATPGPKSKLAPKPKAAAKGKAKKPDIATEDDTDTADDGYEEASDQDVEDTEEEDPAQKIAPKTTRKSQAKPKSMSTARKPAPTPKSKSKSRRSDSEAPTSAGGGASVRQTRRASARDEEIWRAQEEKVKAEASGNFKLKLRNKGTGDAA
jgi:hypothetical protein